MDDDNAETRGEQPQEFVAGDLTFYRDFFDSAPDMFASIRAQDAKIKFCNLTLCNRLGWSREQLIGADIYSIYHPDCHAEVKRVFREFVSEGHAESQAMLLLTKDGESIPVSLRVSSEKDASGRVVASRSIWRDITADHELERLKLDLRLQAAQKTESVALLTNSVAHDFNNLLVTIIGNAGLGRRALPSNSPAVKKLTDIEVAAKQAADLTRQLMTYSGTRRGDKSIFDLSDTVAEISQLLEVAIAKKAKLEYELDEQAVPIWGDVTQLRQVIMNLLTNSADAVSRGSGVITVRTGVESVSRNALLATLLGSCLRPGDFGFLEVRDNGIGLTEEQQRRMFDPFFTTKKSGHGLGLAAVLGIVRAHAGTLSVSSQREQGTTIKLFFPLSAQACEARPRRRRAHELDNQHFMVVDDEKLVRAAVRRMLEEKGVVVTECEDGLEAITMFDAIGESVTGVLMDISMPRRDGIAAYQTLRDRAPKLPIVLMSGLSSPPADAMNSDPALRFLAKPFEGRTLIDTLVDALAEPSEEG